MHEWFDVLLGGRGCFFLFLTRAGFFIFFSLVAGFIQNINMERMLAVDLPNYDPDGPFNETKEYHVD